MSNIHFYVLLLAALAGFGFSMPAMAQVAESPGRTNVEARLDTIEQLLKTLEKRLEAVEGSSAARNFPSPLQDATEGTVQTAALVERIEALDQNLRVVQRKRELEAEEAAAKARTSAFVTAGKDGFSIKSADGAFSFSPHMNIQADARLFASGAPQAGASTFAPFKVRPTFEGVLFTGFSFRIMPDFGNGTTTLQDAYIDSTVRPWLKVRAGKYKGPVGLERLVADTDVEFYERSLPTNLVPNRDVGFELFGEPWGGVVTYAGGIFNGVADGGSADLDADNHHEFEGRVFAHPFRKTSLTPVQGFGLGLAGTSGRETGTATSPIVAGYKTSAQQTFFRYRSDGTAAGTVVADGEHWRISPQAYYYWGPFGAWSEYVLSSQPVKRGSVRREFMNAAWQVAASYVLTGEKASYKAVSPAHAIDLRSGNWGAFEVLARFSELHVDKSAFPFFADPLSSASGAKQWTVGLNWYANKNMKFVFNYEQTGFQQIAGGVKRKDEKVLLERLQLAF